MVLQPYHFLPNGSLFPVYPLPLGLGSTISVKHYKVATDCVLLEDTGKTKWKTLGGCLIQICRRTVHNGSLYKPIYRHLRLLAAFRRYLAANGPDLLPVYQSLMQKIIQVADLLYFRLENEGDFHFIPEDVEELYREVSVVEEDLYGEIDVSNGTNGESSDSVVQQQRQTDTGESRGAGPSTQVPYAFRVWPSSMPLSKKNKNKKTVYRSTFILHRRHLEYYEFFKQESIRPQKNGFDDEKELFQFRTLNKDSMHRFRTY